jgi:hypothetical protein
MTAPLVQVEHTVTCNSCGAESSHRAVYNNMSLDMPAKYVDTLVSCSSTALMPMIVAVPQVRVFSVRRH